MLGQVTGGGSFRFGQIDDAQKAAVVDTEGPMLVVAGPGAGKTSTMVKRISYLVLERGVAPEHIMVATFSRKAAKELLTRIAAEFAAADPPVNVDRMRIGTFHSLCQRLLAEHAERAGGGGVSVVEDFDQKFMVHESGAFQPARDARMFRYANGGLLEPWGWRYTERLVECANTLAEERVGVDALERSGIDHASELAGFVRGYHRALAESGVLDYAALQTDLLGLLESDAELLAELRDEIRYIIVDEYQDTNFIQEQLVLLLAGEARNICVVGDDDQSLYRFRGATVQNILQFEGNFDGGCKRVDLVTNYRSQAGIVDFCKEWMRVVPGYEGDPSWRGCRHGKDIRPNPGFDPGAANPVSVVRCSAPDEGAWHERVLALIDSLRESPDFKDLNQVAFLCSSVKSPKVRGLISFLESHGVPVSAPRANMFFARDEVRAAVGCLLACFPSCDGIEGYGAFREAAGALTSADPALSAWVAQKRAAHVPEAAPPKLGYAFSGLAYEMLRFLPFSAWVDASDAMDMASTAPARNLASVIAACARFEAFEDYHALEARSVGSMPARFFGKYLKQLMGAGGIDEYEDEREYAPPGHVSFMTIHQAKGMEFPVVVVCSLQDAPWSSSEPLVDAIRSLNTRRKELEPPCDRAKFDFWRKYYTAFSRAQDLLVLTSCGKAQVTDRYAANDPSPAFNAVYWGLPDASSLDYAALRLCEVKPSSIMRAYSFTKDVASYRACPRRYKLTRELGFPTVGSQGMFFGTLVHKCVEDIHREVRRRVDAGEDPAAIGFGAGEVRALVAANRAAVEQSEGAPIKFDEEQAARQVEKYLEHSESIWRDVIEPEAAVSEVRGGFVLEGVIDLVHGGAGGVEVVDFKTGKVPPEGSRLREKYTRQMLVYAHLVRSQLGFDVTGAKLYFTSDASDDPVVDVPVSEEGIGDILDEFDSAVADIEAGRFSRMAEDGTECEACPFAGYCGRA